MSIFSTFPFHYQMSTSDCGVSCIKMVADYYGLLNMQPDLIEELSISNNGLSLGEIEKVMATFGLHSLSVKTTFEKISEKAPLPFIAHWNQNHYVVVYKITSKYVYVADPAFGKTKYTMEEFRKAWVYPAPDDPEGEPVGVALLMHPTATIDASAKTKKKEKNYVFLFKFLSFYKFGVFQLLLALFLSTCIQFLLPFFTKSIVDFGVEKEDVNFLVIIVGIQISFYLVNLAVEYLRSTILLHLSGRVNILIISEFLFKMLKLPMGFFSHKITGDLVQRIKDNERIERFITDSLLKSFFSIFSILAFGIVLFFFSKIIFLIFLLGTTIEIIWIFYFLNKIELLDHRAFALNAEDQDKIYEIITGVHEIKLNNIEDAKRWEWERIQIKSFNIALDKLRLSQIQENGQRFLSYFQTVTITFFAAYMTIQGEITLGTLLAIIFILAQVNEPIGHLINFVLQGQLASLSLKRLLDIYKKNDEDSESEKITEIDFKKGNLSLNNAFYTYDSILQTNYVLKNINLSFPKNKITAIVGVSGSGKTTLLKLLLKFYQPTKGSITLNGLNIDNIDSKKWRSLFGVVLQESFIFSDSIAYNITLSDKDNMDVEGLKKACKIANIHQFIENLPLGYATKIGQRGIGLSQGQKQRILIARAVYKDPQFLILDEATNSLDADNERKIIENFNEFFKGRTVIIVAHRLSTVKHADKIVVLHEGEIGETGNHEELVNEKGRYYHLIKNQLEIGK